MGEGQPDLGDQASDGDLVRRTLAGEEQAFEVLVHRYRRLVFRVIRGMVPGAEVEDIGQEAFLRAYRSLGQVQHGSSVLRSPPPSSLAAGAILFRAGFGRDDGAR